MKHKLMFSSLRVMAFFLALAPAAWACTWYVDGVNGNDNNDCKSSQTACQTIGHALSLAKGGHSIMVAPATYTENLTIAFSVKIIGASAATTIVDGGKAGTVFTISSPTASVRLAKLTIRNGSAADGGGINNSGRLTITNSIITGNVATAPFGVGGGINNSGTLTINKSTISGNGADSAGGIYTSGTLTINKSTISRNYCGNNGGMGGGISQQGGTLTINNSTVSSNIGTFYGGGIFLGREGTMIISNTTISGNNGSQDGGGIFKWAYGSTLSINNSTISGNVATYYLGGGGINTVSDTITLQNTIVANNSGENCETHGATLTSAGYNLSSDNTCGFNNTGDLNNTDPKLGQLTNNGGPTQTMRLLPGSPAIDAGNPNGCTDDQGHLLTTDQRGWPRPGKDDTGGCDMGAFERQH